MYEFANYRKQTLFEIIWRILMKYPSHACFGRARSGVNMLTNSRYLISDLMVLTAIALRFQWLCSISFLLIMETYGCWMTQVFRSNISNPLHSRKPLLNCFNFLWLQDLKYEDNSDKAVQCLNDMVTNSLIHIEDCLKYMSDLRDPAIFKFCAIPQV